MKESLVDKMKPLQHINNMKSAVMQYFSALKFDEENHKYYVDKKNLKSVSVTIKDYCEPFDANRIAGFVAKKRGITKEEVLQEWEDKKNFACNKGNVVHSFGENYAKDFKIPEGEKSNLELAVLKFWSSLPEHIHPFLFELQMYSETLGIAGTADIILYNSLTGKFIICDYKTNEDLFKNYKGKKLLAPFETLLDTPYNKYQLQLSMYQLLFEQIGFEVESRRIIWLKPDGTYEIYKTEDYTYDLLEELTIKF